MLCWGLNGNGQLGNGTNTASLTTVKVAGLSGAVTAVAAGSTPGRDHVRAHTKAYVGLSRA